MQVEKEKDFDFPYAIGINELKEIHALLDSRSSRFSYKLSCIDGTVRTFTTLEELSSFDNAADRRIEAIGVNCFSNDFDSVHIGFYTLQVRCTVKGEEKKVLALFNDLERRLQSFGPWYAWFIRKRYSPALVGTLIIGVFYVPLSILLTNFASNAAFGYMTKVLLNIGLLAILLLLYTYVKVNVFPFGDFLIGDGAKRSKNNEKLQTVVVLGVIIGIVVNFISWFLFTSPSAGS